MGPDCQFFCLFLLLALQNSFDACSSKRNGRYDEITSQPKSKSSSPTAASSMTKQPHRTRKNDGIKHKKNNPLQEIIRRATQHRTEKVGFGGAKPIHDHNHNGEPCSICRGSGLVENDRNIAIRCECSAGDRYSHILPIAGRAELSVA